MERTRDRRVAEAAVFNPAYPLTLARHLECARAESRLDLLAPVSHNPGYPQHGEETTGAVLRAVATARCGADAAARAAAHLAERDDCGRGGGCPHFLTNIRGTSDGDVVARLQRGGASGGAIEVGDGASENGLD